MLLPNQVYSIFIKISNSVRINRLGNAPIELCHPSYILEFAHSLDYRISVSCLRSKANIPEADEYKPLNHDITSFFTDCFQPIARIKETSPDPFPSCLQFRSSD